MSVADVGTASPQSSTGTGSPKTQAGAWGTGQNRTAGNLLAALVTASGSTSAGATSESSGLGWTKVAEFGGTLVKTALYTKTAAGTDTAPTFASTIAGTAARCHMSVTLYEIQDTGGTVPVVDTANSSGAGTSGTLTVTTAASVAGSGEIALAAECCEGTAAATNTWGSGGSNWGVDGSDGGSSTFFHWVVERNVNPVSGSAMSFAPSHTFVSTGISGVVAVFKPGIIPPTVAATRVAYAETDWVSGTGSTSKATPSVTWQAGDLLVAVGANEGVNGSTVGPPTFSGGTFAPWGSAVNAGGNDCYAQSWSCTPASGGSGAITFPASTSTRFGGAVWIFRNHTGIGARASIGDTALTISLTRTQPHSRVLLIIADFLTNAPSGSFTPASSTSDEASNTNGGFTIYVADWDDQGSAGATSYGRSAGTGEWSKIALEIIGGQTAAIPTITGAVSMKKMGVAGTGAGISVTTGAAKLKKMSVAGSVIAPVITLTNSFEGGTNAVSISSANSGGASGDAFNTFTGVQPTFSNAHPAHGTMGMRAPPSGYMVWSTSLGTRSKIWFRTYLFYTAIPTAVGDVVSITTATPTTCGKVQIDTTGHLIFTNAAGATIFTFATAIPINTQVRIEGFLTGSATVGQVELQLFLTADGTTADETKTSAATQNTTGSPGQISYGFNGTGTVWHDDVGVSTGGYLGPVAAAVPTITGAVKLKKMTVAGSGTGISVTTGAVSMKKTTVSGTGAGIAVTTGAVSMKKMRAAGSATKVSTASGDVRLKKMTVAGTGTAISIATGAVSMKKASVAGAGTGISVGTGSVSLKKMKAAGTGVGISVTTGDVRLKKMSVAGAGTAISIIIGDVRLKKMAVAAQGTKVSTASGDVRLKKMSLAGAGAGISVGTGAIKLKKMGVAGTGTAISVTTGDVRLKKMTVAGTGTAISIGTGAVRLKKMVIAGVLSTSTAIKDLSGGIKLKKMQVAGQATKVSTASGDVRLKKMGVAGSGAGISVATGAVKLKKMTVAVQGTKVSFATGDIRLKKMKVAVTATNISVTTGAVSLKKMGVSGAGTAISVTTGAVRMKKMRVQGDSIPIASFAGGARMKKMQVSASGAGISVVTAVVTMKKMGVAGSGTAITVVTAVVAMKKMRVSGAGTAITAVTGAVSMKKMAVSGSGTGISIASGIIRMKKVKVQAETEPPLSSPMFVMSML